jgi:hypothetical protein
MPIRIMRTRNDERRIERIGAGRGRHERSNGGGSPTTCMK